MNKDNIILESIKEKLKSLNFSDAEITIKLAEAKASMRGLKDSTAKEVDYWNEVYQPEPESKEFNKSDAINLLAELKNELESTKNTKGEFKKWQSVRTIYISLVSSYYGIDLGLKDASGEKYNPAKGVIILGGLGVGKTDTMKHCRLRFLKSRFGHCKKISKEIAKTKDLALLDYYAHESHLILDDLGTEGYANIYGNGVDPVSDLVQEDRYELFKEKQIKTYYTTNLNGKQLKERYDARFLSRLKETCNIIILSNQTSFR